MKESTLILGHRGARGEMPENTLAGFEYTQSLLSLNTNKTQYLMGGIEFDVQLTGDNKLIITHDDNLEKLCGNQALIDQVTTNYIQRTYKNNQSNNISAKHLLQILTLEQMPKLLVNYQHIELEIKIHKRTQHTKLINSLEDVILNPKFHHLNITLTSFDSKLLFMLKYNQKLSIFKRGLLVEKPFNDQRLANLASAIGANSVGIKESLINQKIIKLCKRYNLKTTAWTVNDFNRAQDLIDMGIDVIITDYPMALYKYLNN